MFAPSITVGQGGASLGVEVLQPGFGFLVQEADRQPVEAADVLLPPLGVEPLRALGLGPPDERGALAGVLEARHGRERGQRKSPATPEDCWAFIGEEYGT